MFNQNNTDMKKVISKVVMVVAVLSCAAMFASCDDFDMHCPEDAPYYCKYSKNKGCCAYEWSDNHGSCYNSLEYCRQTGWNCVHCYIEED